MMESSVPVCPVPSEQQPVNEYEELKASWLFRYCTLEWREYITKIAWLWGGWWLIAGPVAAASFPPHKYPGQFVLSSVAGASLGLILALVRLYLGWSYVRDRLIKPTIFYEESGWYDGQTWTKPVDVLTRDCLIVTYQVQPIIRRLERTFTVLAIFLLAGGLVWNFL